MDSYHLLWVDDEIDLLGAHIRYLKEKGFNITPVTNGFDALELIKSHNFALVLVDEIMPVMGGLEFIGHLKRLKPDLPTVMVTKNEAEELMELAIGRQVDAFLTKPVNPSQILSTLKALLQRRHLSAGELSRRWAQEFSEITSLAEEAQSPEQWYQLHYWLSQWGIDFDQWNEKDLLENIQSIRQEANIRFSKWIEENYREWINSPPQERPPLSCDIADRFV
ncbi:MAG: response regulator, partial [bacterium]